MYAPIPTSGNGACSRLAKQVGPDDASWTASAARYGYSATSALLSAIDAARGGSSAGYAPQSQDPSQSSYPQAWNTGGRPNDTYSMGQLAPLTQYDPRPAGYSYPQRTTYSGPSFGAQPTYDIAAPVPVARPPWNLPGRESDSQNEAPAQTYYSMSPYSTSSQARPSRPLPHLGGGNGTGSTTIVYMPSQTETGHDATSSFTPYHEENSGCTLDSDSAGTRPAGEGEGVGTWQVADVVGGGLTLFDNVSST